MRSAYRANSTVYAFLNTSEVRTPGKRKHMTPQSESRPNVVEIQPLIWPLPNLSSNSSVIVYDHHENTSALLPDFAPNGGVDRAARSLITHYSSRITVFRLP